MARATRKSAEDRSSMQIVGRVAVQLYLSEMAIGKPQHSIATEWRWMGERVTTRRGGWLIAIFASDCMRHLGEFMRARSSSNRHTFFALCCVAISNFEVVVHDDVCHF